MGEGSQGQAQLRARLEQAYAACVGQVSWTPERQAEALSWSLDVAGQRVSAIVSQQHRGSYGKAAVLVAACAETLRLRGKAQEAGELLNDVRNRFPRHRAFQAELNATVRRQ